VVGARFTYRLVVYGLAVTVFFFLGFSWQELTLLLLLLGTDAAAVRFASNSHTLLLVCTGVAGAVVPLVRLHAGFAVVTMVPLAELGVYLSAVVSGSGRQRPAAYVWAVLGGAAIGAAFLFVVLGSGVLETLAARVAGAAAGWGSLCAGLGFGWAERIGHEYRSAFDAERRARFELERTRSRLFRSSYKVAQTAELRERNRIARSLHDSVGRKLTGVLITLEVAEKARASGSGRAGEMYGTAVTALRETTDLLRETVHDMRPRRVDSEAMLREMVDNYLFCPVTLSIEGSLEQVDAEHLNVLTVSLEEALTNIARHSRASYVQVDISATRSRVRMSVENDGTNAGPVRSAGPSGLREGMGISGMRERVEAAGGTFSVTPGERFSLVMVLPTEV